MQVRDRATLHLAELNGLAGGPAAINVQWNIPAKNLEKSLRAYLENGTDAPFDLVTLFLSHATSLEGPCDGACRLLWQPKASLNAQRPTPIAPLIVAHVQARELMI